MLHIIHSIRPLPSGNTHSNWARCPRGIVYFQNATEPSVLVVTRYFISDLGDGQKLTDVIMPVWPVSTAIGAPVCKSHTRKMWSNDPAANSVLSRLMAMSVISADAPRNVANKRPSMALQSFTSKSSAPVIMYLPVRSKSTQ